MPLDASCEDIEVDKSLSFLNDYVQQSLEKGAQPYIPENERSGMLNIRSFRNQDQLEAPCHGLRFEAYELPKPSVQSKAPPLSVASSTKLVPVPEPSYYRGPHRQHQWHLHLIQDHLNSSCDLLGFKRTGAGQLSFSFYFKFYFTESSEWGHTSRWV